MKKSFKLLFLSFMVMTATYKVANASDPVNINVTGNVVAAPCTVDTAGSNLSPKVGDIPATVLAEVESYGEWVPFAVKLKDCPAGTTKATIEFSGATDPDFPSSMYVNAGDAENVSIELQSSSGTAFGNGKTSTADVLADHTVTYNMKTRAFSAKGGATPGTITAVIQATFTYQ